jgi:preprotein translocase subunit SecG
MYVLFTILIVIAAVLLTLLVLVQNSKGGGLAAGFSSSNQVLGVRKTTDFLEKATWGLTGFIIVLSIFAASMSPYRGSMGGPQSAIQQQVQDAAQQQQNAVPPVFSEEMIIE